MSGQACVCIAFGMPHTIAEAAQPTQMDAVPDIRAKALLLSGITAHPCGRKPSTTPRLPLVLLLCATPRASHPCVTGRCVLAGRARERP
jgi:hypothetical protein